MRFISLDDLQDESRQTDSPIHPAINITQINKKTGDPQLILSSKAIIKPSYIEKLREMKIHFVCIKDALTDDIVYDEIVDPPMLQTFSNLLKSVQQFLFPLYLALKEKDYDRTNFNINYRTQIHAKMCSSVQINHLNKFANTLFDFFRHNFRNKPVMPFTMPITAKTYTACHALFSAFVSAKLLIETGTSMDDAKNVFIGTLLQDIGMPPNYYTTKMTSQVDEKDFKEHPRLGCMIINETPALNALMGITVLHHHRYSNRSGFPRSTLVKKLYNYDRGIHSNGKIASITHTYATASLFYAPHKVLDAVSNIFNSFLFDYTLASLLSGTVSAYTPGLPIRLQTGEKCIVNKVEKGRITLRLIYDATGKLLNKKKDITTLVQKNAIAGLWYQDVHLKEKTTKHLPLIFNSFLIHAT